MTNQEAEEILVVFVITMVFLLLGLMFAVGINKQKHDDVDTTQQTSQCVMVKK